MTASIPFSPRFIPLPSLHPVVTQPALSPTPHSFRPSRPTPPRTVPFVVSEDRISGGMLVALIAVTLPAAAYSVLHVLSLVGNDTLNHAVRSFLP